VNRFVDRLNKKFGVEMMPPPPCLKRSLQLVPVLSQFVAWNFCGFEGRANERRMQKFVFLGAS
jgi:hypothetical protein